MDAARGGFLRRGRGATSGAPPRTCAEVGIFLRRSRFSARRRSRVALPQCAPRSGDPWRGAARCAGPVRLQTSRDAAVEAVPVRRPRGRPAVLTRSPRRGRARDDPRCGVLASPRPGPCRRSGSPLSLAPCSGQCADRARRLQPGPGGAGGRHRPFASARSRSGCRPDRREAAAARRPRVTGVTRCDGDSWRRWEPDVPARCLESRRDRGRLTGRTQSTNEPTALRRRRPTSASGKQPRASPCPRVLGGADRLARERAG